MITAYRWNSNWKITLIILISLPLLMRLGFWQLSRADEKQALQFTFEQQVVKKPLLPQALKLLNQNELPYRRVLLQGEYVNEQTVLLDNKTYQGKVGYHVLTPLLERSGETYLINRGWIAGYPDRHLPTISRIKGEVKIVVSVYVPLGDTVVLAEDTWSEQLPLVVQRVDIQKIAKYFDAQFYQYSLRLQQGYAGGLDIHWPVVNTGPEKHMGYAVQWFLMTLALLGFWLYSSIQRLPD